MNHKSSLTLESQRLILRKFKVDDIEAAYKNWMSSEKVCKFLTWGPYDDISKVEYIIKLWINNYIFKNFYNWAICLKDTDEAIGNISAEIDENIGEARIGYVLSDKYRSQGYMTEALGTVIDFFFNEVNINRIEARHSIKNPASGEVMKKCGLTYEGTLRQKDKSNYGITDLSIYSLLRDEYEQRQK
ncbi:MAG: GNAT family N-acetyltransferase [Finegoldia sp.]|nr:GNAT family N-acetyltransferase [Finegoldia sp.]